jgi:hypothetical protein
LKEVTTKERMASTTNLAFLRSPSESAMELDASTAP